jgi:NADH-quinone oxidoreductase subunit L
MTMDPVLLALTALLTPALSFLVIAVVFPLRRSGRPAAYLSVLAALVSLSAAAVLFHEPAVHDAPMRAVWSWLPSYQGTFAEVGVLIDGQSSLMLVLVTLVATLVQIYSLEYLHDEPPAAFGRYYAYHSLFVFSMMGVVLAPNLLQLFVCWELVGVCSYLLIGFWYRKPEAARAALKAFWTTKAGDVGLLIGIVLLHRLTGTWDLTALRTMAEGGMIATAGLGTITFLMYLGAMGKSAQFPLHVWLPDAMEGPTPVSALIHAATMVTAGVYLLVRTEFLFHLTPGVLQIVGWIGAITALIAAILACVQNDIKKVLAYSTVSQLGYMMTAVGAGFAAAGFLHLLTHGVFKALLFLGAGAVIHGVHSNDVRHMGGLRTRMPQTFWLFVIGTLSLAGVPLFAGFVSKEEILGVTLAGGLMVPFVLLLAGTFLTAFYMTRIVALAFFGAPRDEHAAHAHEAKATMTGPMWVLGVSAIFIGLLPFIHHDAPEAVPPVWLTPLAMALAFGGIGIGWLTYGSRTISADMLASVFAPIRYAAERKFWLDDLYLAIYRYGLMTFSRAIGWLDRYIVDGVLNVVSAWTLDAGDALRRVQTGKVQDYIVAVGLGLLALLLWMRGTL